MPQEIERKFLVIGEFKSKAFASNHIVQGYIATSPGKTVRIRISGDKGYLTITGRTNGTGISRYEWEKEIPLSDAEELIALCDPGVIIKTRYYIKSGKHVFEVDEFSGDNTGLVIAEVELGSEDEAYNKPDFIGEEVTGDLRYYNSHLIRYPYSQWDK